MDEYSHSGEQHGSGVTPDFMQDQQLPQDQTGLPHTSPYGQAPSYQYSPQPRNTYDPPPPTSYSPPPPSTFDPPPPNPYGQPSPNPYGQPPPGVYGAPPPNPYGQPPPNMYAIPPANPYGQPPPAQYAVYQPYVKPVMPGKTMIRATSIVMIVFSFYGLIFSIAFASATAFSSYYYSSYYYYDTPSAVGAYLAIAVSILALAFGITGTASAAKKSMAKAIMGFGITLLALGLISIILIFTSFGEYGAGFNIVALIFTFPHSIILPILLVVGGNIRKNAPL